MAFSVSSTVTRRRIPTTLLVAGTAVCGGISKLCQLDRMAVRIFYDDDTRLRRADRHRHPTSRYDGTVGGFQSREQRIEVSHEHYQHGGARILNAALDMVAIDSRELDELHPAKRRSASGRQ